MRQCRQTDRLVAALHTYYSCKVSVLNYYYDKKFMSKTAVQLLSRHISAIPRASTARDYDQKFVFKTAVPLFRLDA